jgi:uncharacterized protein with beta-barrel porin domain
MAAWAAVVAVRSTVPAVLEAPSAAAAARATSSTRLVVLAASAAAAAARMSARSAAPAGIAGTFGGTGGAGVGAGGGGGAALGGAVFVATGGTLTIVDGGFAGTYTLTAGAAGNSGGGGATAGQAQGRVLFLNGTGAINFSLSSSTTVTIAGDDAIAGTGALGVGGSGTLAIGGANPNYTGTTTVNGGRLAVNGTLPGAVVVNAGGILGGTGTVGATTINGGTLAPGNSIGTITLASLTMSAGSTYAVEVSPAAADRTNVTGAAALGGTVQALFQAGSYTPRSYTILSATGGRSGTFGAAISSTPFLTTSLSYTPTDVLLNVSLNATPSVPGLSINQQNVLTALGQGFAANGISGDFGNLIGLSSALLPAALTSLSGEISTGVQNTSFAMGGAFFHAITGQMQSWRAGGGGAAQGSAAYRVELASAQPDLELAQAVPGGGLWPPPASAERRFAVWGQGFGLSGGRDGDAIIGSSRLNYSMGGGASGFDVQLAPGLLAGTSVAAAGSDFSLQGQPASGTAHTIFFGLYGAWTMGPLYVDAAAGYGHASFTTTRTITLGPTSELAQGNFDGNQYGGDVEAGWRFAVARYQLTPFAGVAVEALHQDSYSESSRNIVTNLPGTLGLAYAGRTTTSVRSFLGGEATTTMQLDERTTLTPRVRLAWAHEFDRTRQVNASFLSLPGAAFTVYGAQAARDAAVVVAGADVAFGRSVALFAEFEGDFAGGGNAYAGSGGIRITW